jgi:hypothetical protein
VIAGLEAPGYYPPALWVVTLRTTPLEDAAPSRSKTLAPATRHQALWRFNSCGLNQGRSWLQCITARGHIGLLATEIRNECNIGKEIKMMNRCFVIQPFDKGPFDKRYNDVLAPAVREAELEPYRVDYDPHVSIPIEDIEKGIRNAAACLVDISVDNPNVWFELGYAIAAGKDLCLICSEQQKPFPFDVQHRKIIRYKVESSSDFSKLGTDITERLKAILKEQKTLQATAAISPTTQTEGLLPHEMAALVAIMKNRYLGENGVSIWSISQDMVAAGFTDIATSFAIENLVRKELVVTEVVTDVTAEPYTEVSLTNKGLDWLMANQDKIILRQERQVVPPPGDDIPF